METAAEKITRNVISLVENRSFLIVPSVTKFITRIMERVFIEGDMG